MRVGGTDPRVAEDEEEDGVIGPMSRAEHMAFANRITGEVQKIVRVVIGVNPQEPLDMFGTAQDTVAPLRIEAADITSRIAQHKARHWGSGTAPSIYEQERKMLLTELAEAERARLAGGNAKVTEALLDNHAHTHSRYAAFVDQGKHERSTMEALQADLARVNAKIANALGAVDYYEKAVRLAEEYLRFAKRTHDVM